MKRRRASVAPLPAALIDKAVSEALAEDLGLAGDITTTATIPANARSVATIGLRKPGVISGLDVAAAAFRALDAGVSFKHLATDGAQLEAGAIAAKISGNARAILTAERVALNFLGRMSGIATLTHKFVDAITGTRAAIIDTRKTTPGLRAFEKYAIRCGGGMNHRFGLFDAILIKDNHIVAAGGLAAAIEAAREAAGHTVKIEIEVDTLDQLQGALNHRADIVLLDNMSITELAHAVELTAGKALLEASGGVSLDTVRAIAQTGVDLISVGALTHSAQVLDLGLDFADE